MQASLNEIIVFSTAYEKYFSSKLRYYMGFEALLKGDAK